MFRPGNVMKTMARPDWRSCLISEKVACFGVSLPMPLSGSGTRDSRHRGHFAFVFPTHFARRGLASVRDETACLSARSPPAQAQQRCVPVASQARMEFFIEPKPRGLVAPFEVPSIGAPIVSRRIIPCDTEFPVRPGERTQEGKFENVPLTSPAYWSRMWSPETPIKHRPCGKLPHSALPVSTSPRCEVRHPLIDGGETPLLQVDIDLIHGNHADLMCALARQRMGRHLAENRDHRQRKCFMSADVSGVSRLNCRFDVAIQFDLQQGLLTIGKNVKV